MVPLMLLLKIGAIVIYLRNDVIKGLTNGTVGRVVGFVDGSPRILFDGKSEPITISRESFSVEGGESGVDVVAKRTQVSWLCLS
jgi:hypothetical protein